jgi:hypothetical protein
MPAPETTAYPFKTSVPETHAIYFEFAPNGASAVSASSVKGVASVTRTGAGVFDITLKKRYGKFLGIYPTLQSNAAIDMTIQQTGAETVTTSNTAPKVTITCQTAAVATDIAANANTKIRGIILVSRYKGNY